MNAYKPAHVPCERRVDGDRVTELLPAREFLSRSDKNCMQFDPTNAFPPRLPTYASRDHLHDRNREISLFDPANPGLQTYVRVTRRRHPDRAYEAAALRERNQRLRAQFAHEQHEAAVANELLALRSANIREHIANRSRGWTRPSSAAAATTAGRDAQIKEMDFRLKELRKVFAFDTSPPQIAPATVPKPAPPPPGGRAAARAAMARQQKLTSVPLRGGWPVDSYLNA